jgi:hypothetical protein
MSNNFYCNKDSIIDHFPCLELFDWTLRQRRKSNELYLTPKL